MAALVGTLLLTACAQVPRQGYASGPSGTMAYALGGPEKAPAVVLQSGLGDGRTTWDRLWPLLTARHRAFALDRPGYGDSPSTTAPRDPCQVARETHAVLHEAKVPPPYLLVGHSLGGLYQFAFARLYPDETAGMRLLDPTHPAHWATLPNHFHLVVETPQPNLVAGMKWLLGTYTSRFNRRHRLFGHLFCGCYKSLIVDGSGSGYLKSVCDYVHLDPALAKLVAADAPLKGFAWSSWPEYLRAPSRRPARLRVDRLLGGWGIPKDSPAGRQRLEQALEARRGAAEGEEFKPIRRSWCLGGEVFRQELLAQMSRRLGAEHYGAERAETAEALTEQIIARGGGELKRRRWKETDLKMRPKGDAAKLALAARLRAETTLTVGWIAERLCMGTRGYLNHLLYRRRKTGRMAM